MAVLNYFKRIGGGRLAEKVRVPCYYYPNPKNEDEYHKSLAGFLRVALPPGWKFNHQPNEGSRGWASQRKLGDDGTMAGWPDIQILGPVRLSFFLELKWGKGILSDSQKIVVSWLSEIGFPVAVVNSYSQAERVLLDWGVPLTVTMADYADAWTGKRPMTSSDYNRLILGAVPPKPIISKPKKTTKSKVAENGKAASQRPRRTGPGAHRG